MLKKYIELKIIVYSNKNCEKIHIKYKIYSKIEQICPKFFR